jgi:hypothetical protein
LIARVEALELANAELEAQVAGAATDTAELAAEVDPWRGGGP